MGNGVDDRPMSPFSSTEVPGSLPVSVFDLLGPRGSSTYLVSEGGNGISTIHLKGTRTLFTLCVRGNGNVDYPRLDNGSFLSKLRPRNH